MSTAWRLVERLQKANAECMTRKGTCKRRRDCATKTELELVGEHTPCVSTSPESRKARFRLEMLDGDRDRLDEELKGYDDWCTIPKTGRCRKHKYCSDKGGSCRNVGPDAKEVRGLLEENWASPDVYSSLLAEEDAKCQGADEEDVNCAAGKRKTPCARGLRAYLAVSGRKPLHLKCHGDYAVWYYKGPRRLGNACAVAINNATQRAIFDEECLVDKELSIAEMHVSIRKHRPSISLGRPRYEAIKGDIDSYKNIAAILFSSRQGEWSTLLRKDDVDSSADEATWLYMTGTSELVAHHNSVEGVIVRGDRWEMIVVGYSLRDFDEWAKARGKRDAHLSHSGKDAAAYLLESREDRERLADYRRMLSTAHGTPCEAVLKKYVESDGPDRIPVKCLGKHIVWYYDGPHKRSNSYAVAINNAVQRLHAEFVRDTQTDPPPGYIMSHILLRNPAILMTMSEYLDLEPRILYNKEVQAVIFRVSPGRWVTFLRITQPEVAESAVSEGRWLLMGGTSPTARELSAKGVGVHIRKWAQRAAARRPYYTKKTPPAQASDQVSVHAIVVGKECQEPGFLSGDKTYVEAVIDRMGVRRQHLEKRRIIRRRSSPA
jgi:hypothetical protein